MTAKKAQQISQISEKTLNEISVEIANLQGIIRDSLSGIEMELIKKKEDLDNLETLTKEKGDELSELHGKEKILLSLQELSDQYQEEQRKINSSILELRNSYEDQKREFKHSMANEIAEKKALLLEEDRARKEMLEEENFNRQKIQREEAYRLQTWEDELKKVAEKLGVFEERVKAEVAKQVEAIKREFSHKERILTVESTAKIDIFQSRITQLTEENNKLTERLNNSEKQALAAIERANAVAIASVDAESGKKALDELRTVAHKQAESGKR